MIQRIQTLFLALAALCMAMCFFSPAAQYTLQDLVLGQTTKAELNLLAKSNPDMLDQIAAMEPIVVFSQKDSGFSTWPFIALAVLVTAIAVACIFLYKNRVRQARVVMVGFVLNLAYVFLLFFWGVDAYADVVKNYMHLNDISVTWTMGAYLPIASLLLLFLANRAIRKDEEKVRAADRLR